MLRVRTHSPFGGLGVFGALAPIVLAGCTGFGMSTSEPDPAITATTTNIASLSEVVQRNPNDPQAYNVRGAVLGRAGRNEDALSDFNKAIAINPNYAQAYANRGLISRQTNKLDLALAYYNKALSIDPNYAQAYLGRGMVYRQQGRLVLAENLLLLGLGLGLGAASALVAVAPALLERGSGVPVLGTLGLLLVVFGTGLLASRAASWPGC